MDEILDFLPEFGGVGLGVALRSEIYLSFYGVQRSVTPWGGCGRNG